MNRQMNLPALQRIAMEFERENDIMDQRQEMMDDAIDEVTGLEDEEEGEEVVKEVLDEIGIDLGQAVVAASNSSWYMETDNSSRWEKHRKAYRRLRLRMGGKLWQLVAGEEKTTIFRHVWTACGDD